MSFNLATILRESAKSTPDKALMHFADRTFSYAQVEEMSGRVAASLLELGLRPGQVVAVQLPNVPQFLFAYLGIIEAGLVMMPLNPLLRATEIAYHLSDSDAALLITFDAYSAEAIEAARQVGGIPAYVVTSGEGPLPDGTRSFDELYRSEGSTEIAATNADDTAVLLYTSGTTGRPKGAELTHFQMFMACTVGGETFGYRPDDVALTVLPLFHVFGLSSTLNVAIRYGGSVVLVPRFEPAAVLDALERWRCTVICGFEEKFPGVVILEGYGLSETVAVATFNRSAEERRVLSIGKPLWGVDIRIVDDEDRELPPGQEHVGEIVMRGHNVMKGYLNNPAATAEAMRGGWFHTGDLAYRDADGFLFIVDRKKDLVIRGGFNVYPREVEEVLYQHAAVAEAAVVGRPDERLGEEVVAYVTVRPGASAEPAELIEFCKQRLAAYKYPRAVQILDDLPRNATGKVLKSELRA